MSQPSTPPIQKLKSIPYGRQWIEEDDIDAVVQVLRGDWLTQGPAIPRFESAIAQYCGAKYAVAVTSATAGLHLACLSAGIREGDWVWTTPNTFVASANCARYCGAQVDFVDIDPSTLCMDPNALARKLEHAKANQTLPKAVIPVDFAGNSAPLQEIYGLAQTYGFVVIEDAAHGLSGRYLDAPIGACPYSDMAVFSFHPVKPMTTGEGGMVVTNNETHYQQLLRLRTHGITKEADQFPTPPEGPWSYAQVELGYNYRMTDIQAALGISQLGKLDALTQRRRKLAARYMVRLTHLPLILPSAETLDTSAWHLFVIQLDPEKTSLDRKFVFEALREEAIQVNIHYIPVHTQPYYQTLGFKWGQFPHSETYYHRAITLPLYPGLSETDQDRVIHALQRILEE